MKEHEETNSPNVTLSLVALDNKTTVHSEVTDEPGFLVCDPPPAHSITFSQNNTSFTKTIKQPPQHPHIFAFALHVEERGADQCVLDLFRGSSLDDNVILIIPDGVSRESLRKTGNPSQTHRQTISRPTARLIRQDFRDCLANTMPAKITTRTD
jgi:hypothetical protein